MGRIRRRFTSLPDHPVIATINRGVQFEHMALPFLDEDDFRAMLTQSYDISLCDYIRRTVKPGDIVLDVGANVGYISAVSASYTGSGGEVHGFEPLWECYARLERLRALNPQLCFRFNNVALGETEGFLPIAYNPAGDSRNATLVPGKHFPEARQVPVKRLDQYIKENIPAPERIKLIKIDVEGFEFPVLLGLKNFLLATACRPAIVCEIKPWELTNFNATPEDFDQYMRGFGYRAYVITEEDTPIRLTELKEMEVVVFRT